MPPEPRRLVADVDAALAQKVLDVAQRHRCHQPADAAGLSGPVPQSEKGTAER